MNISEAKQVLQRYRIADSETKDSSVQEAFQHLEKNPELQAWLEKEEAFNQAISSEFQSIAPPPELRNTILEAMEATRGKKLENSPGARKTIPFLNWTLPLTAAAALVIALIVFLPRESVTETDSVEDLPASLAFVQKTILEDYDFKLEKRGNSLPSLQAYLASYGTPSYSGADPEFRELNPLGCLRLNYKSVELGLICFEDDTDVFHVLSASKAELATLFPDLSPENLPVVFESGETSYRVWIDDQHVNILTHNGSNDEVSRFF